MAKPNYHRCRDGKQRVTVNITHHILKEEVQWVAEKTGVSERVALKHIKSIIENKIFDAAHFYTYAVDNDGELTSISIDDVDQCKEDGYEVYG